MFYLSTVLNQELPTWGQLNPKISNQNLFKCQSELSMAGDIKEIVHYVSHISNTYFKYTLSD